MKVLSIDRRHLSKVHLNMNITNDIRSIAYKHLSSFDILESEIESIFLGDVSLLTVYAPIDQHKFVDVMKSKGLKVFLYRFSFLESSYVIYLSEKLKDYEIESAYQIYRFAKGNASFEKWDGLRSLLNRLEQ